ncbi:MAG: LPS assembly protein LptD, partial [Bryobacteraceae bacterium]
LPAPFAPAQEGPAPEFSLSRPSGPARPRPPRKYKVQPPNHVPDDELLIRSLGQIKEGPWYRLRGMAQVETSTVLLRADEIDYNEDTEYAEARGHVYLQHFEGGEELWAERVEYNLAEETGKFYQVRGSAPLALPVRPHLLSSSSPFHFEGKWAERLKEKYLVHDGFITDCRMPTPWWILRGPLFDVIPGDRAIAYRSIFWLRRVPIFYSPFFYKSLQRQPRRSGFLTPNLGNSSRRGKMVGAGYFWAINRSYDATYRAQYFTQSGLAHTVDFRGKPREGTDFNAYLYGVPNGGVKTGNTIQKLSGLVVSAEGRSDLGGGFHARAEVNYLSSFAFRQAFTETFSEAISSEVHSLGSVSRQWSTYSLDFVLQRLENFQSTAPNDTIVIRKLPEVEFSSRDRRLWRNLPIWISWESSGGLLYRKQIGSQTRNFVERLDLYPRVTTALHWKDCSLVPSFAIRESHYGESQEGSSIIGHNINRSARELEVDLILPSLARVYDSPKWLGDKIKHVIEPSANYRYVTGVDDFDRLIRFDETELYSNTNQVEISLINRIYAKRGDSVQEVLSWQLKQDRYFDPTFGGAVGGAWCGQPECRNVVLSSIELSPYAFLDGPRHYSPVASILRVNPKPGFGVEWRSDWDPLRSKVVNNSISADARFGLYYVSIGHNSLRTVPALAPNTNQFRGVFMIGNENRRGWNAAFNTIYDFRIGAMQFATTQVTYNTDCCGFSVQYHRFSFGTRNENQFRVSFVVANIGSFGTLKKQERLF